MTDTRWVGKEYIPRVFFLYLPSSENQGQNARTVIYKFSSGWIDAGEKQP